MSEPNGDVSDLPEDGDEDEQEDDSSTSSGELVDAHDSSGFLEMLKDAAELERRRLGTQKERNKIALRALEVSENSDRRQFEFHKEKLATEERARDKSHSLARLVIIFGGGATLLLVVLVIIMAFFGNEKQSEIAMTMIGVAGKAAGGAGFIYLVAAAVRRLTRS